MVDRRQGERREGEGCGGRERGRKEGAGRGGREGGEAGREGVGKEHKDCHNYHDLLGIEI